MSDCRWKIIPCESNLQSNLLSWTIENGKFECLDPRALINLDLYISSTSPRTPQRYPKLIDGYETTLPEPPVTNIIDDCGIINYPLLTIFKHFEFSINGTVVDWQADWFGYTSILKALTEQSGNLDGSVLEAGLFKLDQNMLESTDINSETENLGLAFRSKIFKDAKIVRVSGFLDLISSPEPLWPGISGKLTLYRQPDEFTLMTKSDGYTLRIKKAEIMVKKHLQRQSIPPCRSIYATRFTTVSVFPNTKEVKQVILGLEIPSKIIVLQVLQDAAAGSFTLNPFNLQHFNVKRISLCIEGVSYPMKHELLDFNWDDGTISDAYLMARRQIYGLEMYGTCRPTNINVDEFKNGNFFWPILLDHPEETCTEMVLNVKYAKPLEKQIILLVIAYYNRTLTKDPKCNSFSIA
jgi:hypothetical protein